MSGSAVTVSPQSVEVEQPDAAVSAFGRLRVVSPATIFESKQTADAQPLQWDDVQVSGAGTTSTHSAFRASSTLAVSAATAGRRVRQTKRRFNYEPGKGQLIMMTGVVGPGSAGITKNVGQFDDANGIFLSQLAAGPSFVLRSSVSGVPVDTAVAQAAWSEDPLDGTGPSGITLDLNAAQVLVFDYAWLGAGTVRCGFLIDGRIVYAHRFNTANVLTSVFMSTPNNPLRYEIVNDGAGGAATLEAICVSVISEGGQESTGKVMSGNMGIASVACTPNGTTFALYSIRLKTTHLGSTIDVLDRSLLGLTAGDQFLWDIRLNPTVAAAPVFTDITNSALQQNIGVLANTVTAGSGTVLASGYGVSQANLTPPESPNALRLGATVAGVRDVIALCVTPVGGAPISMVAGLMWRELS